MANTYNYRHLYYFWVVAKEGGISRAAEKLDMAVQTVSAQVRELERALGYALLLNPFHSTAMLTLAVMVLGYGGGASFQSTAGRSSPRSKSASAVYRRVSAPLASSMWTSE